MDGSSSPFLERPSRLDTGAREVARLEYELSALKTEKKLLQQSKDASIARYEELLSRKNNELSQLQTNFDFVYGQRKELQSKIKNQQETAGKSSEDLTRRVRQLSAENKTLNVRLEKYERQYQASTGKCEHLRADLNRELAMNDQYREKCSALEAETSKLTHINDSLLERINALTAQLETGDSEKKVQELQLSLLSSKKVANDLQATCDSLLQRKYNNELLKQKVASLTSKLQAAEKSKAQLAELKLSNAELNAKFNEYFAIISAQIGAEGDSDVLKFISSYKQLQNKNLIISDKLREREAAFNDQAQQAQDLGSKIDNELAPLIENLREEVKSHISEKAELLKSQVLNQKEIEFLRKSLKDLDQVVNNQRAAMNNDPGNAETNSAVEQYLSNLEKLVDEYKQEIEQARKKSTPAPLVPTKRPRLIEDDQDIKTKNLASLRAENLDLLTQLKMSKDERQSLKQQLKMLQDAGKSEKILEMSTNPFAKDQLIKQEVLNTLRRENEALIAQYVQSIEVETVPKSVFARQENDKDMMQTKIDELVKKNNRLKSVYADKSREIIAMMSRFFGYTIEFIPSPINPNDVCSRIKLVSRYMVQDSEAPPYLMIDVRSKALKAHGSYEFKTICEELVQQWVGEKNQIPCFLSALNLKIYDQYVKKGSHSRG